MADGPFTDPLTTGSADDESITDSVADAIEELLGGDDDATLGAAGFAADDGGYDAYEAYADQQAYDQLSHTLAEVHASNLEVIDNIDGSDDYEYTVEGDNDW